MTMKPLAVGTRCRLTRAFYPENVGLVATAVEAPGAPEPNHVCAYWIRMEGAPAAWAIQYRGPRHGEVLYGVSEGWASRDQLEPIDDDECRADSDALVEVAT
ncbi:MAG: hypothetical protein R3E83_18500 [Burkholderiaceae bacterium]